MLYCMQTYAAIVKELSSYSEQVSAVGNSKNYDLSGFDHEIIVGTRLDQKQLKQLQRLTKKSLEFIETGTITERSIQ